MKITKRVVRLLYWINGFGWVSVAQVAKYMSVSFTTAARMIRRLVEAKLVRRVAIPGISVSPLVVTSLGCKIAGDGLTPLGGIRVGEFRHDGKLVDVARELEARFGVFEPARRLRQNMAPDDKKHLPDGILHRADGTRVIIELELTAKAPRRLARIIREHAADLSVQEVWYVTDNAAVARAVRRASAAFEHVRVVRLTTPSPPPLLTPESMAKGSD
jgi:DNA-binding Lrp family transcriptional regulator